MEKKKNEGEQILLDILKFKSGHKQDVFANTKKWFVKLKRILEDTTHSMSPKVGDDRIRFRSEEFGDGEARLFLGSDVLVFQMHSNVFKLPDTDYTSQTSYVQKKPSNGYCGIINVYDFLADSYEFGRHQDIGYLICRIFINKENHFKIEGKGPIGFMYQDFMNQKLTVELLQEIILRAGIYALEFDLLTPPYQTVSEVSVGELQIMTTNSKLATGKRLGFKFRSETNFEA